MHGFRWVLLYSCALANSQNSAICNGSLARISNFLIDIRAPQMRCINLGDTPIYYPSQGKKKRDFSAWYLLCLHLSLSASAFPPSSFTSQSGCFFPKVFPGWWCDRKRDYSRVHWPCYKRSLSFGSQGALIGYRMKGIKGINRWSGSSFGFGAVERCSSSSEGWETAKAGCMLCS